MPPSVAVCICTFRRPEMLLALLRALGQQCDTAQFRCSICVVDNDSQGSAEKAVNVFRAETGLTVRYEIEPEQNIALARNRVVSLANSEYLAFIDDDEIPGDQWIRTMLGALQRFEVDGVLGPVLPKFESEPPAWVRKAGFYQRPDHPDGMLMNWQQCRTGNVLLHRRVLDQLLPPFDRRFGAGGEDQDFFRRAARRGFRFAWCEGGFVTEVVPEHRYQRGFLLHRALLRGRQNMLHPEGRISGVLKSVVAVPVYAVALPLLVLMGHHLFMRYLVKLCDHAGKLLAAARVNPVKARRN